VAGIPEHLAIAFARRLQLPGTTHVSALAQLAAGLCVILMIMSLYFYCHYSATILV
jgi:hypothetical protein